MGNWETTACLPNPKSIENFESAAKKVAFGHAPFANTVEQEQLSSICTAGSYTQKTGVNLSHL